MFLKLGSSRIVNATQIIEAVVYEPGEYNLATFGPARYAEEGAVRLVTKGTSHRGYIDGTNGAEPYEIVLFGEEARAFLEALPVYEPTKEDR